MGMGHYHEVWEWGITMKYGNVVMGHYHEVWEWGITMKYGNGALPLSMIIYCHV